MLNYIGQMLFSAAIRILLVFSNILVVLIVSLATPCLLVIDKDVQKLKSRCEKKNAKIWKLMMDKVASARENATLKSRCEEGDEKIRKLTMDKWIRRIWPRKSLL